MKARDKVPRFEDSLEKYPMDEVDELIFRVWTLLELRGYVLNFEGVAAAVEGLGEKSANRLRQALDDGDVDDVYFILFGC